MQNNSATIDQRLERMHGIIADKQMTEQETTDLEMLVAGQMPAAKKEERVAVFVLAAHHLNTSYDDVLYLAHKSSIFWRTHKDYEADSHDAFFDYLNKDNTRLILSWEQRQYYQYNDDLGCHRYIETAAGKKQEAMAFLSEFKTNIPFIVVEMPDNKSSMDISSEEWTPAHDCTHEDYDLEAAEGRFWENENAQEAQKKAMRESLQHMRHSDNPAAGKLREFCEQHSDLTDITWTLGFNTKYMAFDNVPHYHVEAKPGKRDQVKEIMKNFATAEPVIITEMTIHDYASKLNP